MGLRGERRVRDAEAEELFAELYPRLVGWATAATGDVATGQDVAAEAFVKFWSRWGRVENPRPWLWTVAANLVRDYWRGEQRSTALHGRLQLIDAGIVPGPDVTVQDLVRRLPQQLRMVVVLHYYADLPVAEVARVMRRPEGSVKRLLSQARSQLAAHLEDSRAT
jgi:RNA polymerase sigma-70 factor (ECF subfamily)